MELRDSIPGFGLFYVPIFNGSFTSDPMDYYAEISRQVQYADQHGWRNVWLAEHHGTDYGGLISSPEVLGAYLAAQTRHIRIGPAISIINLHDPLHLADRYSMLDQLSGGRLDMGLGRGFIQKEFALLNKQSQDSIAAFAEAHDVLLQAWKGEAFDHAGKYYQYTDARSYPIGRHASSPPIWIAASKTQESFQLAGRFGHNLMINPYTRSREEVEQGLAWYQTALADSPFSGKKTRIAAVQHLYCGEITPIVEQSLNNYFDQLTIAASAGKPVAAGDQIRNFSAIRFENVYPEKIMFGSPEFIRDRIAHWTARGITDFCFIAHFGNLPWELAIASIQKFTEEVLPVFDVRG